MILILLVGFSICHPLFNVSMKSKQRDISLWFYSDCVSTFNDEILYIVLYNTKTNTFISSTESNTIFNLNTYASTLILLQWWHSTYLPIQFARRKNSFFYLLLSFWLTLLFNCSLVLVILFWSHLCYSSTF